VAFSRNRAAPVVINAPAAGAEAGVAYGSAAAPNPLPGKVTFTAVAAAWTSQDIAVDQFECLAIDLTKTTVTTNVQFTVARKGADGVYYVIATSGVEVAAGADSLSVGQGVANVADTVAATTVWSAAAALGDIIRIVVTPTGAFTGTLSVKGK
jgi:hypothetical protein